MCNGSTETTGQGGVPDGDEILLTVSYEKGDADMSTYTVSYVSWVANSVESMLQHLFVSDRVADDSLSDTPLSYWNVNYRPQSSIADIDAVSMATHKDTDFIIDQEYIYPDVRQFRLYFEIDYSYNENDWFLDQPGLVYYADIDLDSAQISYTLQVLGWAHPQNIASPVSLSVGELNTELQYITHQDDGAGGFGAPYLDNTPATHIVGSLVVTVTQ